MGAHKYNKVAILATSGNETAVKRAVKNRHTAQKIKSAFSWLMSIPWRVRLFINRGYMR